MTITPIEIFPHPHHADQRIFPLAISSRAAVDAGERPIITVTGTDGTEDRHGSVISPEGWDLSSFNRNPVVTWSHQDDTLPAIGRAPNPRNIGGSWDFDIEFATEQWRDYGGGNLAALIFRLMKDDYLRAVSVAFIPKQWKEREATTIPSFFAENVNYLRQELTAISPCNIGSNRNGLKKAVSDRCISENEATLLGLGSMMRVEMPIMIVRPKKALEPEERKVRGTAFRTALKEAVSIIRCGGDYGDYYNPALYCPLCGQRLGTGCDCREALSPEEATAEQTVITSMSDSSMAQLTAALEGWKVSEHDQLRSFCSAKVWESMWAVDRLVQFRDFWYPETDLPVDSTPNLDTLRAFTEATAADPKALARAGAEFSKKNKSSIRSVHDHAAEIVTACRGMLDDLEPADDPAIEDDTTIRVIHGSLSAGRAEGAGHTITVTATDLPGAGTGERSTPPAQPDLYDEKTLAITR